MLKVYNGYAKFLGGINKVLDVVCIALMLTKVAAVFYQVIMRQIFDNAPAWSEESALIMMAWFVYLGIVIGVKEGLHIGITMLVNRLPKIAQFVIEIIVNLLILTLAVLLFHFGYSLATFVMANSLPATGLSVSIFYFPVAIAGLLMILMVLGKVAEQFVITRREPQ